jgi:hypothetical protein
MFGRLEPLVLVSKKHIGIGLDFEGQSRNLNFKKRLKRTGARTGFPVLFMCRTEPTYKFLKNKIKLGV